MSKRLQLLGDSPRPPTGAPHLDHAGGLPSPDPSCPPPLPPNPGYVTGFVLVVCYCIRAISAEPHRLPSRFRTSLSLFARRTKYKRHLSVDGTPVPRARWIWRLARRLRRPRACSPTYRRRSANQGRNWYAARRAGPLLLNGTNASAWPVPAADKLWYSNMAHTAPTLPTDSTRYARHGSLTMLTTGIRLVGIQYTDMLTSA